MIEVTLINGKDRISLGNMATGKAAIKWMGAGTLQQFREALFSSEGTQMISAKKIEVSAKPNKFIPKIYSYCQWLWGTRIFTD